MAGRRAALGFGRGSPQEGASYAVVPAGEEEAGKALAGRESPPSWGRKALIQKANITRSVNYADGELGQENI